MKDKEMYEFRFPDIGEGIHEGRVLEWMRHPGDRVSQGEVLALVETDKVVAEMPSPRDGILRELAVGEGEEIQVGQVLARLELSPEGHTVGGSNGNRGSGHEVGAEGLPDLGREESRGREEDGGREESRGREENGDRGEDGGAIVGRLEMGREMVLPPSAEGAQAGGAQARGAAQQLAGVPKASEERASSPGGQGKVLATPVARKLAARLGVELTAVPGSGPAGRVLKDDILRAAGDRSRAAALGVERNGEPRFSGLQRLSTLRRTLARNMERSWQIPAAVVHELTEVEELAILRGKLNDEAAATGSPRLSYLPFFIKVAALSLKRFPLLNSLYHPEQEAFETREEINVGFALDSEEGLVVPVIRNADLLTLSDIQTHIDRRRGEAANRALDLAVLREGTFTISNYGSIGGLHGRPLILPPQVAILGLGRIHEAPVVRDSAVVPSLQLPLSLVFDHRLIDGAYAAGFLALYMALLSAPHRLLALMR